MFGPKKQARSCLVFLLAPGVTPRAVTFRPPEGVVPLTWTGDVTVYGKKAKKNQKKNKNKAKQSGSPSSAPTDAPTS